jgi:hypothetical protein
MLYVLEHDTIPVDPSLHAFMHACTYEKVVFDGARAGATGWWQIYPLNVVESGTAVRFKGVRGLIVDMRAGGPLAWCNIFMLVLR